MGITVDEARLQHSCSVTVISDVRVCFLFTLDEGATAEGETHHDDTQDDARLEKLFGD